MKRLLVKSLVAILLALGIGNYLIYLKTGQIPISALRDSIGNTGGDLFPTFSSDNIKAEVRAAANKVVNQLSATEPATATTVYKWTDAEGRVHFSDKPLVQNAQQLEVKIRNAISAPEPSMLSNPDTSLNKSSTDGQLSENASPLEKARAAAEAMNARAAQQEQSY